MTPNAKGYVYAADAAFVKCAKVPLWKPITTLIKATKRRRRMTLKTTTVVRNYLELIAKMKKSYEIKKKRALLEFVGFWLWIHLPFCSLIFCHKTKWPLSKPPENVKKSSNWPFYVLNSVNDKPRLYRISRFGEKGYCISWLNIKLQIGTVFRKRQFTLLQRTRLSYKIFNTNGALSEPVVRLIISRNHHEWYKQGLCMPITANFKSSRLPRRSWDFWAHLMWW